MAQLIDGLSPLKIPSTKLIEQRKEKGNLIRCSARSFVSALCHNCRLASYTIIWSQSSHITDNSAPNVGNFYCELCQHTISRQYRLIPCYKLCLFIKSYYGRPLRRRVAVTSSSHFLGRLFLLSRLIFFFFICSMSRFLVPCSCEY